MSFRSTPSLAFAALFAMTASAMAQAQAQGPATTAPAPNAAPPAAAEAKPADPVVARVNGQDVHLSDVMETVRNLPANMRGMPQQMLLPMVQERQVDFMALVAEAKKNGLENDPAVKKQVERATEAALQNAWLTKVVGPQVTEDAIKKKYDAEIAGKPGAEEVHAEHILVSTEKEADQVIADLKKGADFAAEAKKFSKDPGGKDGGDLGWFKKDDMVPAFADAAFAMKPGQTTDKPVKTEFGYHVIRVLGTRQAPPPTFEQAHDTLRQQVVQAAVQNAVKEARADAKIEMFNLDGTPVNSSATPPATAPAPAPAAPTKTH